jgi:ABC-type oligopeptide transport system ATPase subunit
MSDTPMLEIKNLVKVYGKGEKAKTAVDNISLSIPRGSFFGLQEYLSRLRERF